MVDEDCKPLFTLPTHKLLACCMAAAGSSVRVALNGGGGEEDSCAFRAAFSLLYCSTSSHNLCTSAFYRGREGGSE